MNGAIAPGSHAEKSPHKGEHDNARTHTHTSTFTSLFTPLASKYTIHAKKKSTNKDIFEQEQKKFLK